MEEKRKCHEQFHILYKPLFFSVSALIALISVTVAWFAANSGVGSGGMKVSITGVRFELAGEGQEGLYYEPGKTGEEIIIDGKTYYKTSAEHQAITWMVGADSNLHNDRDNGRLSPGAKGKITFYILPNEENTEDFTVKVSLHRMLYGRSETVTDRVIEDRNKGDTPQTVYLAELPEGDRQEAEALIQGHMLFFQGFDGTYYSDWISGDILEIPVSGTDPVPVTIYWVWPYVLDWLVDTGTERTLCDSSIQDGDYQKLLQDIQENPSRYLRRLPTESEEENTFSPENMAENAELYRLKYNRGDEFIGTHANYLFFQITAQ